MKHRFYNYESRPFHVTGHCKFNIWPNIPRELLWCICIAHLDELLKNHQIVTHSFVLMSNHFHWLCACPENPTNQKDIKLIFEFITESFEEYTGWGDPALDKQESIFNSESIEPIENIKHYTQAYKYIYRNPVNAGMVKNVEDYPLSTLQQLLGQSKTSLTFFDQMNFIYDSHRVLSWLNSSSDEGYEVLSH